jgi:hypothetical protein
MPCPPAGFLAQTWRRIPPAGPRLASRSRPNLWPRCSTSTRPRRSIARAGTSVSTIPPPRARLTLFASSQASAFNGIGAIWAPRYRQATIGAFLTSRDDAVRALDFAYRDVARAFDAFVSQVPAGQPIVLAGHSQGSLHLTRLLQDKVAAARSRAGSRPPMWSAGRSPPPPTCPHSASPPAHSPTMPGASSHGRASPSRPTRRKFGRSTIGRRALPA